MLTFCWTHLVGFQVWEIHIYTLQCETHGACFSYHGLAIYVRYFVPLRLENHSLVIHLHEIYCTFVVGKSYLSHPFTWDILIYCTFAVGKSYLSHPFMLDILYLCGWKIIPLSSIYVRYIVPLQWENHTLVIHLC